MNGNTAAGGVVWGLVALGLGTAAGQGHPPTIAAIKMTAADGLTVRLVASEPLVRQPVAIEFDDRGRLWVIQYLQYPNPEGLRRREVDRYSRTKYDRIPDPPPRGPRGADRISILSDTDGDGVMDAAHDFVAGLNLTTGLAFGHGGVFVLNVPYLLFYPDRDRDDRPDSDPEVLLTGFGMEDAHSVANSLTWGPDGWLYGCQGSTVTANIRGIEFQQGVWRYHPVTRQFELFCEGGGNSWGLDFDRLGNLLYSTNHGGFVLLHGVQGGYYTKSFAKHGELHNPHAYGYFPHAPHAQFQGGHVTVGGIVYQGDALPEAFRGRYIAGDLLGHGVYWHRLESMGSTVRTAHGGELLRANDAWFAPTDLTVGPDGAVYVADWHDARTAHPDPDADWDRSNGRIYRLATSQTPPSAPIDVGRLSTDELVGLLRHRNQWQVRKARMELADRQQRKHPGFDRAGLIAQLQPITLNADDEVTALEALWTLHVIGGVDEELTTALLDCPHPAVRAWAVRLAGDGRSITSDLAHRLDKFAEREPVETVRQQLACTARRLPAAQALPIINANINRDIDIDDPFLPLLWWWAVEAHSVTGREEVLKRFVRPSLWMSRLGREILLPRLLRRYTAEATTAGWDAVARLVKAAPTAESQATMWPAILLGWQEQAGSTARSFRTADARRHPLAELVLEAWNAQPDDAAICRLAISLGHSAPIAAARQTAFDPAADPKRRVECLQMLEVVADATPVEPLFSAVTDANPLPVRQAALRMLARYDRPDVGRRLVELYPAITPENMQATLREVVLSRPSFAQAWLTAVDQGAILPAATPVEQIRKVALFKNPQLDALVVRHWGRLEAESAEEKLAEVRRLRNDLRAGAGDPRAGKELFKKHCANCHQLFGEGTKLGPDLTTANRQDRDYLLVSLVDPSSVIRKEHLSVIVATHDGRVLTGLPVARDDAGLTLADGKGNRIVVNLRDISETRESQVSLMPADLHRSLKPQDLRDLFAYLQAKTAP